MMSYPMITLGTAVVQWLAPVAKLEVLLLGANPEFVAPLHYQHEKCFPPPKKEKRTLPTPLPPAPKGVTRLHRPLLRHWLASLSGGHLFEYSSR